jgi:hypothetical protein
VEDQRFTFNCELSQPSGKIIKLEKKKKQEKKRPLPKPKEDKKRP